MNSLKGVKAISIAVNETKKTAKKLVIKTHLSVLISMLGVLQRCLRSE